MRSGFLWLAWILASTAPLASGAQPAELVLVDEAGNAGDASNELRGAVAYEYWIGRYEVTNLEYAAFLNAVAADDPNALYAVGMSSIPRGGITRSGSAGSYTYAVNPGFADRAVVYTSFLDEMRYANWLENGQPTGPQGPGTTELGSYDLAAPLPDRRLAGARWVIANEDEWYKAAYYDPSGPAYRTYATGFDAAPTAAVCDANGVVTNPGANVVVFDSACNWNGSSGGNLAPVGSAGGPSAFGTYDQSGSLIENTERIGGSVSGPRQFDGYFGSALEFIGKSNVAGSTNSNESSVWGFRIVDLPEPMSVPAGAAAIAALGARRATRRRRSDARGARALASA